MTYCLGMLLDTGMVFLSDSRTNAGVDQISTFRKTNVFQQPGERVLVVQTAGNLALTQAVITTLRSHLEAPDPGPNLLNCRNMFEAAQCIGEALRQTHHRDAHTLKQFAVEFNAAFILGGQIKGEQPRLFTIYAPGNFIEATAETSYFQIGESKYGKPIIDRVVRRSSSLYEAAKAALVSMDSTIRSNLSVGLPLDLVLIRRDRYEVARHVNIDEDNAYFAGLRKCWSEALREVFAELPEPDWLRMPSPGQREPAVVAPLRPD
jgi:putative proteasome-type protease